MTTSSVAEAAKGVVAHIAPQLKAAGFRKRRHSFNRRMQSGLVHEFSLVLISVTSSGYGTGYFHAGCFVPAAERYRRNVDAPKWVSSGLCCIRGFYNHDKDGAWPGNFHIRALAKDAQKAQVLVEKGLRALDTVATLDQIMHSSQTDLAGMRPETPLPIIQCCIALDRAQTAQAKDILAGYLSQCATREKRNLGHEEIVTEWGRENGLI